MCKKCISCGAVSVIATWGFFALLLTLLNAANALVNAIWLTLLICVATACCPVMNPNIAECCQVKPKKPSNKPKNFQRKV